MNLRNPRLGTIYVSDPKPMLNFGLSLLPMVLSSLGQSNEFPVDVFKAPVPAMVIEPLFPNVTFFFDEGKTLRWENHYSLDVPELTEAMAIYYFGLMGFLRGF